MLKFLIFCFWAAIARSQTVLCVETTRPINCPSNADPVCGQLRTGERKDFASACAACANIAVATYKVGRCAESSSALLVTTFSTTALTGMPESLNTINTPQSAINSPDNRQGSTASISSNGQPMVLCALVTIETCKNNTPVCATFENGDSQTRNGSCEACQNPKVLLVTDGPCQNNPLIKTSAPNSPSSITGPQIVPFQSDTSSGSSGVSPLAMASATAAHQVSSPISSCSPTARLSVCLSDGLGVCGQTGDGLQRSYTDYCAACRDPSIVSYFEGSCAISSGSNYPSANLNSMATFSKETTISGAVNTLKSQTPASPSSTASTQPTTSPPSVLAKTSQNIVLLTPPPSTVGSTGVSLSSSDPLLLLRPPTAQVANPNIWQSVSTSSRNSAIKAQSPTGLSIPLGPQIAAIQSAPPSSLSSSMVVLTSLDKSAAAGNLAGNPPAQSNVSIFCQEAERSPSSCFREPKIVCAYFSSGAPRTFKNVCDACINPTVSAYTVGGCPEVKMPRSVSGLMTACVLPRRPVYSCTLITTPVCGIVVGGITRTFLNPCLACAEVDISGYVALACEGTAISVRDIILSTN